MTSGALVLRWSVHGGQMGSARVFLELRWTTLEKVLVVGTVRR
jgi:hypothetical protein